jgi:cation-transporting ATPase E
MEESALRGLNSAEVEERIAAGKSNGDCNVKTKSVGKILFDNVFTLFNLMFTVFAVILVIFLDKGDDGKYSIEDFSDFGFVFVMLANMFIGIIQELKAKATIDRLSLLSAPKVTVLRDGAKKEIAVKDIVLDDITLLSAGKQVCADGIIKEGYIEVNESLLTGEPDAIPKKEGEEILSGSFVVSGNAKACVTHVGKENYATKIVGGAKRIKSAETSEIRNTLVKFIRFMGIIILPLGATLFLVKYFLWHNELYATVRSVLGNLIGMVPSGLVMLTSAIFCVSVIRLGRHKTLSQDLYCVETLARIDTLCLDKTGTLTEGRMEVSEILAINGGADLPNILKSILAATGDSNITAEAVKDYVKDAEPKFGKADRIIPFSSKYKYSGATFGGKTYILGAPEFVLKQSLTNYSDTVGAYAEKGLRVLVLAETAAMTSTEFSEEPVPTGFVVLSDVIRREAPETLNFFAKQGVDIKIISGDNAVTVSKIADRAGVKNSGNYIDASTLTDEKSMAEALEKYTVFGRTTPDQKLKFVKILKAKGHTVGMTGDGVNDVLALKEADCSVAMASGSDAAKSVSRLVLLDNNFASMPKIVAEGRRTVNNLERSASLFLVKTIYNFLFAFIFLFMHAGLPFEPKHMTFLGALTIGIPSYVLALEPNDELVKGKFFRKVISEALPAALTVVICVVAATLACGKFPEKIDRDNISTVCTILAGLVGFMLIAKISYPYNALRIALLICLIAMFAASFFVRFPFLDIPKFFGLSTDFCKEAEIILLSAAAASVPLFIGLVFLIKFVNTKNFGKRIKILDAFEEEGEK